jgi:hypothetical protein
VVIAAAFMVDPYPRLARRKKARKQFFFEKKNQKTLLIGARGAAALMPLML